MSRGRDRQHLMEDFPAVTATRLRKMAASDPESSCRFGEADYVQVLLPDGRAIRVDLVRAATNLGHEQVLLVCPACRRTCRTLRIVPDPTGLVCAQDVQKLYKAKYKSQLRRARSVEPNQL